MGFNPITLALANKYTDEKVASAGGGSAETRVVIDIPADFNQLAIGVEIPVEAEMAADIIRAGQNLLPIYLRYDANGGGYIRKFECSAYAEHGTYVFFGCNFDGSKRSADIITFHETTGTIICTTAVIQVTSDV